MLDITLAGTVGENLEPTTQEAAGLSGSHFFANGGRKDGHLASYDGMCRVRWQYRDTTETRHRDTACRVDMLVNDEPDGIYFVFVG
jgi:hypothetical protein